MITMVQNTQAPFCWVPGATPDPEALERLRRFFPKPTEPMGEAWFMSEERTMYDFLLEEPLDEIPVVRLWNVLDEISSGFSCFGEADKMWRPWFFYLLAHLAPRAHDAFVLSFLWEPLISAFITQFPGCIDPEPYPGFAADIFATLGRAPMSPKFWRDGRIQEPETPEGWEDMDEAERDAFRQQCQWVTLILDWDKMDEGGCERAPSCHWLSAQMFFCIKYLPDDSLEPWLQSAFCIRDPIWIADLLAWLVGYRKMRAAGSPQPEKFSEFEPDISWDGCSGLNGIYDGTFSKDSIVEFIPESRYLAFESLLDKAGLMRDRVAGLLEKITGAKRSADPMEKDLR